MEHYITFPTMQEVWDKTNHVIKALNFPGQWEYEENDDCGGGQCFKYQTNYSIRLDYRGIYICSGFNDDKYLYIDLDKFDIATVDNLVKKALPDLIWPRDILSR